jgi:hypothetical protein
MKCLDISQLITKLNILGGEAAEEAIRVMNHQQMVIHNLMEEYEPNEITKEQWDNWASHQRRLQEDCLPAGLRLTATKEERHAWLRGEFDAATERLQMSK